MPKVSVVIPIYNMGDRIDKCLNSLFEQTFSDYEIIIIDDGSTDDSLLNCKKYEKDYRLNIYHTDNQGSGPARNYGVTKATGSWLYFPDADDEIEANTLETLFSINDIDKFDLIVFGYKVENEKHEDILTVNYKNGVFDGNSIRNNYSDFYTGGTHRIQGAPWNKLFKRQIVTEHALEFPTLRRHQDEAFIARYVNYVDSVYFCNAVLYTYHMNSLSMEWKKYPTDYYKSVMGLYNERKKNLLCWNSKDIKTHNLVYCEYIYNCIKCLELSFAPKFQFSTKERMQWIKRRCHQFTLDQLSTPKNLHTYQKLVKFLINHSMWVLVYHVMKIKVELQNFRQKKNV